MLPFLYPRALRTRAPAVRAFLRSLHDDARPDTPPPPPPRRPRRPALQRDPIPFVLPADVAADLAKEAESQGDQGTITPSERQAFRRLFGDLAERQRAAEAAAAAAAEAAALSGQDSTAAAAPPPIHERINTIVDQAAAEAAAEQQALARGARGPAVPNSPLTADERRQQVLAAFPPSLRAAAGSALGIKEAERRRETATRQADADTDADTGPKPTTAMTTAAAQARHARQTKMELLMLAQKSDVALWDYMEAHVFSLVGELGLGTTGKGKKKKKTTATTTATTTTTTTTTPSLLYAPLYPALLLHGLRLLDTHFCGGRTSPLAFALLPRIKALGLASHVLGASTPLYNRLAQMQWARRGDAAAVFALLAEMQRAGLAYDGETRALLQSMEWHLVPVWGVRAGGRGSGTGTGTGTAGSPFIQAAVRTLPELVALPDELAYWKMQVDKGIALARR